MSDYQPGDILLLHVRGTLGAESTRADEFRVDMALCAIEAIQQAGRVDTYSLSIQRCVKAYVSEFEPAQFEKVAGLFAVFSPDWQFALDHHSAGSASQRHYIWRPEMSDWMSRVWLGDHYERVPLACFVEADALKACIETFLQTEGGRCSAVEWISRSDLAWRFQVNPEDELPNRRESLVRPASTVALPELEVFRQLGQVSFREDVATRSLQASDQSSVLLASGSSAEVQPLNAATIAQICDQLNRTDWSQATRFISIFQGDSRFSPVLGYVALYGHPLGVFVEFVKPHGQSEDHYSAYSPLASVGAEQMVRIWVGMHYRRVPLHRLVQPARAIELVIALLSQPQQPSQLFQWPSESDSWLMRISPEDDIYDPLEPLARPASQTPVPSDELYERLMKNYTIAGLPTRAIRLG